MTAAQALAAAVQRLKVADVPDAANDARILLAHAVGIERSRLTLVLPDEIPLDVAARFDAVITARCNRQPVSQIVGSREFYGRDFIVTPDVLDPRPETEFLVEAALAVPFENVLDLGVGSGCILLTLLLERANTWGAGTDVSPAVLKVFNANRAKYNLEGPAVLQQSNWFDNLGRIDALFDLIVSNPPYISALEMPSLAPEVRNWEPEIALTPGGDGLDAYRIITAGAPQYLTPNGHLIVEIGMTQADAVRSLFEAAGFEGITTLQDMDGHDRVISGHLP